MKLLPAACASALMIACSANPQRLPIGVSQCAASRAAGQTRLHADIENRSDRPIAEVVVSSAFYQAFRYQTFSLVARMRPELDPGMQRRVLFDPDPGLMAHGQAIKCFVTHIRYLDGTTADAPAAE